MLGGLGIRGWCLVGVVGVTLPACGAADILSSREQLLVEAGFRTDAASYTMASGVSPVAVIRVSLDNRFGTALIPVPCTAEAPEWVLERRSGERWVAMAAASCDLVTGLPTPIGPGEEYGATVRLPDPVPSGVYRLVFGLLEETDAATTPVLDGRAHSNSFTLVD